METLSAYGLVGFSSPDQFNLLRFDSPEGECCRFGAVDTHGSQLDHLFRKRNQVYNVSEGFSLESTVKCCYDDNLAGIGQVFCKIDDIFEELSLIDTNDVSLHGFLFDGLEL
jgi:hypothetical protein